MVTITDEDPEAIRHHHLEYIFSTFFAFVDVLRLKVANYVGPIFRAIDWSTADTFGLQFWYRANFGFFIFFRCTFFNFLIRFKAKG